MPEALPRQPRHHPLNPPIMLIAALAGRQIISKCCEQCLGAGVAPGMTLAHARALLPSADVHVEDFDPADDDAALASLAMWAARFSPIVAADPPDGLLLDVTGCQRVHGGERRMVNHLANSISWLGFQARLACACTFACAWGAARCADDDRLIIDEGAERQALTDLPVQALKLEPATVEGLREVNIDRVGQLFDLPRSDLAERFGDELLLRLDQALGQALETIVPVRPDHPPRVERVFDGPVKQLEGILITVRELVGELCGLLEKLEHGALRLDLDVQRIDAAALRHTIMLSRPNRHAKHLWSLLQPRVHSINLGYGIERLAVTASRIGRLRHEQSHSRTLAPSAAGEGGRARQPQLDQAVGELVDAMVSRLGPQAALRVEPAERHIPERAFLHRPLLSGGASGHGRSRSTPPQPRGRIAKAERPSLLLAQPELIDVIAVAPEGPPSWLRWRGQEHIVRASFGPERIADEWWCDAVPPASVTEAVRTGDRAFEAARDYFKVQIDAGRWLWVFRRLESGRWFVHGEWA